jgi:integrase
MAEAKRKGSKKKGTKHVTGKLSATRVERERTPGRYADGGGLYLQVGPTGGKSWLFRYMLAGKAREMGLGPVDSLELAKARKAAERCREQLNAGVDPIEAREADRAAGKAAAALELAKVRTFKDCAESYIKAHRDGWKNAKHADQWTNTLTEYAYPVLGALPVSKVDTGLVLQVLEPIWKTKAETASRVRGRIESVLDWARVRKYREGENPARWRGHLDKLLAKRSKVAKVQHHPALPYAEAGQFVKALRGLEGISARALEFIILTAARTSEAIGAKWDEFDLKAGTWTIPADRMKARRPHTVPLSPAALAILEAMKAHKVGEFVFPGAKAGKSISNMACLKVLERMKRGDLTVHGFRSTFRDWAAECTNFPREVAEAALAHTIGDKVEAAYRRGDLIAKRRALMEAWAKHCGTTKTGDVRGIREKRSA